MLESDILFLYIPGIGKDAQQKMYTLLDHFNTSLTLSLALFNLVWVCVGGVYG